MKLLMTTVAASLLMFAIQDTVVASDPTSLAEVAAIVADAMATNDTLMIERYERTYEDVDAGPDGKKISKSDFLKIRKERKALTEDFWRQAHEKNIIPEDIKIVDVQLRELPLTGDGKYNVVATVFPVFKIKGELIPLQWAMLTFGAEGTGQRGRCLQIAQTLS